MTSATVLRTVSKGTGFNPADLSQMRRNDSWARTLFILALLLCKELEDRLVHKEWKLESDDVIRDLDNRVEMEVSISGKGYVFAVRPRLSGQSLSSLRRGIHTHAARKC